MPTPWLLEQFIQLPTHKALPKEVTAKNSLGQAWPFFIRFNDHLQEKKKILREENPLKGLGSTHRVDFPLKEKKKEIA